jgi:hypothetical protein
VVVLQGGRTQLLRQIDELEEQARHNVITPGALRAENGPEEPAPGDRGDANSASPNENHGRLSRKAKGLENSLAEEKEHLEHVRKEAELLRRDLELKKQQVYSNPEQPWRRSKLPELVGINSRLAEKQAEVQETEQKTAELEDQLEDFKRSSTGETEVDAAAGSESANDSQENDEKNEVYWRKKFAAIDYKIRIAQTEPDILQRELNLGLIQYDPNPATAMKGQPQGVLCCVALFVVAPFCVSRASQRSTFCFFSAPGTAK